MSPMMPRRRPSCLCASAAELEDGGAPLAHRERLRAIFVPKFRLPKYLVYHVLDYWAHFGCYYTADPVEAGKKNKIKDKERRKKKNVKSKSKKKGRNFSKL